MVAGVSHDPQTSASCFGMFSTPLMRYSQPAKVHLSSVLSPLNQATLGNRIRSPTDLESQKLLSLFPLPPLEIAPHFLGPACGVSRWSCLGLSVCRLVRLRWFQLVELTSLRYVGRREGGRKGSCDPRVSRKASPCSRVVLAWTAVSFLWRDGRVGLPA